jgi:hypothetical protein
MVGLTTILFYLGSGILQNKGRITMNSTATQATTDRTFGTGSGSGIEAQEHSEGTVAKSIEKQTAKLPSDLFLWAAAGAIGTSFILEVSGNPEKSRFVGQWVAPFLLLGVYNKLVKQLGSDRTENSQARAANA